MFQGYTQETVDFLWGIRFNNERGWFMEHKQIYQTALLEPTRALGGQIYDGLHAMLPDEPLQLKVVICCELTFLWYTVSRNHHEICIA